MAATNAALAKDVEAQGNPPPYGTYGEDVPPPPNYEQAAAQQPSEPPPSYESLYGRVKAVQRDSTGKFDCLKKTMIILLGTLGCTIMIAVIMAIPITMIVIGALHLHDCPVERYIPIYLVVAGSFGILKNLSSLAQRLKNKDNENADEENAKTNPFDSTLNCFLFAWFIAGNVWIYKHTNDWSSDPNSFNYCHPTCYLFAFWVTTATYILIGTICCCVCCGGILAAFCGNND